ncbi:MAG: hypothetical protein ACE15B_04005 [Bryobacteraceae bacterium]
MDALLRNSHRIFDAAEACARAGRPPADLTILIGPSGHIQLVAGSDWPLDRLQTERGAAMAFRVNSRDGRVRVSGRSWNRSCRLETETPAAVARRLLR